MQSLTTGSNNVAVGRLSMLDVTTGSDNVGVGKSALQSLTTGVSNTAVGQSCLAKLTSGINNNAIGANALVSTTYSIDNNAMGGNALLRTTTGSYNTGVGARALNENTTGSYNVGIGQTAGYDSITGSFNTFIGAGTGFGVTSGENNTIIGGRVSGLSASLSNTVIIADGAGNQRLRIDSNGQAGINEQTPMAQLHTTVGSASRVGQITKLAATPSADADQILDSSNNKLRAVTARGKAQVNGTITAAGTTGARTINKPSGAVNFAAGATSLVVTCDQCTATSMVKVYVATNDTTMKSVAVVPGSGSFTLHPNAAPTAETRVFFEVIDIV